MDVMILSGGYGIDGSCGVVVNEVQARLQKRAMRASIFRNDVTAPPIIGTPGCWESDVVKQLREMASKSHALVLISPEYHGTMSSTMKLQLDWLSKEQLAGKPVALVSLLGGKSNTSTLNHMRHVCRWLGALCIPEQIAIPNGKTHLEGGVISNSDLSERLDSVLESLLDITHKLH